MMRNTQKLGSTQRDPQSCTGCMRSIAIGRFKRVSSNGLRRIEGQAAQSATSFCTVNRRPTL